MIPELEQREMQRGLVGQQAALGVTTFSERLQHRKQQLEQQLADVNEALNAIQASPEVQRAVDALSRVGHF